MTDTETLLAQTLDAARHAGADAADVLFERGVSLTVGVADRQLEEAERAEAADLGLRVLVGQRQACVASSDLRPETLREIAERAVAMARAAPEDPYCGLAMPEQLSTPSETADLELADPTDPPDPASLEETALRMEAAALAVPGVTMTEQASAAWGQSEIAIAQSNGFSGGYSRTSHSVGVSAIAGSGLARERDYSYRSRHWAADLPIPEDIGREAGERAVARLEPKKPASGAYPVLYHERVAGSLIGHLLGVINGRAIARGASWVRDAMGTAVLPKGIDLMDEPLLRRGMASRPFDAEGLAARPCRLVDDGILQSWLLDLATARQLELTSTGHARRGVAAPPAPGVSNIRMTQGNRTRDELIRDLGTGLLVTGLIGASVNANTGAYSRGANGFWIERGEIAHPVNEITVAGSLPEMMKSLIPADDGDPMKALSIPSLLVEGITIGA
ncbi:MAG: TldD/PmbA family protein [Pseudomonadota bacterium]